VQKLALLFPAGRVGFEQAREAVLDVARFDVFDLGGALLEGDAARMARMIDGLRGAGIAPPLVLWALTDQIRAIGRVLAAAAAGSTPPQLWREARIFGAPNQALMQRHVSRFTREQVEAAIAHAAKADRMAKGLARGDVWDELLRVAVRFARGAPRDPAAARARSPARAAATAGQHGLL